MSDRCYLKLYIHGYFKDVNTLNAIAEAIDSEGLQPDVGGYQGDIDGIYKHFADYLAGEVDCPQFFDDACNYANITELENTLRLFEVAYMVDHDAGADYPASCRTWVPQGEEYSTITAGGEAMVSLSDLKRIVNDDELVDPLAAFKELILQTEQAMGMDMPVCNFAPEVEVVLAKRLALNALGVTDESGAT